MTRKQAFMTVVIAAFVLAANRPAALSTAGALLSHTDSATGAALR